MKRICMLFGSPRKGGNSETMAEALVSEFNGDVEIDRFHLCDMTIDGCLDCRKCWSGGRPCIIDDEMHKIYESLAEADAVIFATPLYWYTWSAQIKPVIDRFVPFVSDEALSELKGKKAILVASAGDTHDSCFDGLLFAFRESCNLLEMEITGEFCYSDLYTKNEAAEDEALMEDLREAGKTIL